MVLEPSLPRFLRRLDPDSPPRIDTGRADQSRDPFTGIRCPLCAWRPSASSRWRCGWQAGDPEPAFSACGTSWNTFSTRGRCPGCHHQWRWTSCLACHEWSRHTDWYED